jgi:hypothetical protein
MDTSFWQDSLISWLNLPRYASAYVMNSDASISRGLSSNFTGNFSGLGAFSSTALGAGSALTGDAAYSVTVFY